MMWRTISTVAAISLILPLNVYAAQLNSNTNNTTPTTNKLIAHDPDEQAFEFGRKGRGYRMQRLWEQLDLTPEQSTQIETIRQQSQADTEPLRQELYQARAQMRSLLAENADPDELRQQHQQIHTLHQQLGDRRFETMLEVREILTPEQRSQMSELIQQHRGRRGFGDR
ncbi:Spy/CpxP family protein refolding chaperone [Myxosarcina sp. GI1(2024)]